MDDFPLPRRALYRALAVLAAPFAGILLVLALAGELAPGWAAVAAGAAAAALWLPVRRHLSALTRLAARLDAEGTAGEEARRPLESPLVPRRLAASFADAEAAYRGRLRGLAARAASAESVLDNLPDPVIAIDRTRRIVRATRGTTAVLGGDPADVEPTGADLVTVLRDPGVLEAVERIAADGGAEEVDFLLPGSGREFAARIAALPEPAPDGAVAVVAVTDVTEARRHGRMRADFVANASHELGTPISVLLGCIETLRGAARDDPEASERFLGMMGEQTERMRRLVDDLLSLSRIELNEHNPPSARVSLAAMIPPVVDALQFAARSRGIEVTVDGDLAGSAVVGDGDELTQLFQNLIDNAIKYGAEGSTVRIAIGGGRLDGADAVSVAVSDEGEGIPAEHLQRLTERFYRVDTARSREMGGTGLGLAIVKHIVNRHRGALDIESEPAKGSVFTVSLPCAPAEAGTGRNAAPVIES